MLDKYVWRVLFLALLATASFATPSSGPSCHDDVLHDRTRLHNMRLESGQELESSVTFLNDTTYEKLDCLGFNPQLNLISATIGVKLPYGFLGGLCTNGSYEYVRFWVNYGSGPTGWNHIGMTLVNTHDILDSFDCNKTLTKPLYYTLSIKFEPDHRLCLAPLLPRIRATLSWNKIPSLDPYDSPVWGNILEESIQSLATTFIPVPTMVYTGLESNSSTNDMGLPDSVDEGFSDRCRTDQEVFSINHTEDDIQLDVAPNVYFEELTCLGLDWGQSSLVATVRVKLKEGYRATPCKNDHFEHVSFWADWGDNCEWVFLGTTKFNVHDFNTSPSTGLVYTALMPVNVRRFSSPCNKTKIARVRAALAFNQDPPPPPATAPRGNYIESHVHLQPYNGGPIDPKTPHIRLIGNVRIEQIYTTPSGPDTGMTLPKAEVVGALFADPTGPDYDRPSPFGGKIIITGEPFAGQYYRIMVSPYPPPPGYPGLPVLSKFKISSGDVIIPSIEGYFKYQDPLSNLGNVLSWWTPDTGMWQIRLEMAQRLTGPPVQYVHEGYTPWYIVRVNQREPPPTPNLNIFGTECNDLKINDEISGTFTATSAFLDQWGFSVTPGGIPNPITFLPPPPDPLLPVTVATTWKLATTGARACGYNIWLTVWDRTVVDSGYSRYFQQLPIGFCLRK